MGMTRREHRGREILVSDRISPLVKFLQRTSSRRIWRTMSVHEYPESEIEATEIGTDIPGIGITSIQPPIKYETAADHTTVGWVRQLGGERIGTFRVETATEPLKLRRQQQSVRLIDLLRRGPGSRTNPADRAMGGFEHVESRCTHGQPLLQ